MTEENHRYYQMPGDKYVPLEEVVRRVQPNILIGTTATPGIFTEDVIRAMDLKSHPPIVLALSNPTSKTECTPEEVLKWTNYQAWIATGSPFPPVAAHNQIIEIGQANNAFVFPGIGLGCILAEAHEVTIGMFHAAATALAECVTPDRLNRGAMYPDQSELRDVSRKIAARVIRRAREENVGRLIPDEEIDELVADSMWFPDYENWTEK
jgi:malate dehydrogenase (oxaloacetate-decarboxylating)